MAKKAIMLAVLACALDGMLAQSADAFTIRSNAGSNKCLDIRSGYFANRTPLQTYTCNNTLAQWFGFPKDFGFSIHSGAIAAPGRGGSWCIDMPYTTNGSLTWIFQCWGGQNQKWEVANAQVKTATLNRFVSEPSPFNSKPVEVGPDYLARSTRLTYTVNNELRFPDGRCLDVPWSTADHTRVVAYPCHGGENQKWYPSTIWRGYIFGLGGMCLTASANAWNYGYLEIRPCMSLPEQQWLFDGASIRGDANKCLTTQVNPQDWQNVFVRTCDGSREQRWTLDLSQPFPSVY